MKSKKCFRLVWVWRFVFCLMAAAAVTTKASEKPMDSPRIIHLQKIWVMDGKMTFSPPTGTVGEPSEAYLDQRSFIASLAQDSRIKDEPCVRGQNQTFSELQQTSPGFHVGNASNRLETIPIKDLITGKLGEGIGQEQWPANVFQKQNDLQRATEPHYLPDLTVPSCSVVPQPIIEGSQVIIAERVFNNSYYVAGASKIALYLSRDGDADLSDDTFVGKQDVSMLAAGGWQDHSWQFTFPDLGSGTYGVWLAFVADCDNQVTEANENNLFVSNQFTVQDVALAADLRIYQFLWTPGSATEGQSISIRTQVYNNGTANATAGSTVLYLATNAQFDNSVNLGALQYPALAPGNYIWLQWDFIFPDMGSGVYQVYVGASVDHNKQCSESDENNFFTCNNTLSVTSAQLLPDLQSPYFWYANQYVTEGDNYWVASCVYNTGAAASPISYIRAWLSVDGDFDTTDDHDLGKKKIPALAPDSYEAARWDFSFPNLGSGTYPVYLLVMADCDSKVQESDENNNLWRSSGSVQAMDKIIAVPDIAVDSLAFTLSKPRDAEENQYAFHTSQPARAEPLNYNPGPARFENIGFWRATGELEDPEFIKQYRHSHPDSDQHDETSLQKEHFPASIDWSKYDSPIRDQGNCGGCWAFAAIALVENLYNQKGETSRIIDLSEQELVACTPPDGNIHNNCSGGLSKYAIKYISDNGLIPENCFPFEQKSGTCSDKCASPEYLVKIGQYREWDWIETGSSTVSNLKALLQKGPVKVSMNCPNSFLEYSGGIYSNNGDRSTGGHAILAVGYNDTYGYFKIKNSWGTGWGENGYGYLAYSTVTDDQVNFGGKPIYSSPSAVYILDYSAGYRNLLISNEGSATLNISNITYDQTWLSISNQYLAELLPGEKTGLAIGVKDWKAISAENRTAKIQIYSNDPDEAVVSVTITANPDTSASLLMAEDFDTWNAGDFPPAESDWYMYEDTGHGWKLGALSGYDFDGIEADNVHSLILQGEDADEPHFEDIASCYFDLPEKPCTLEFWFCASPGWKVLEDVSAELYIWFVTDELFELVWEYDCCSGGIEGWEKIQADLGAFGPVKDAYLIFSFYGQSGPGIAMDGLRIFETGSSMDVTSPRIHVPDQYTLRTYPNPFNPDMQISFTLPARQLVELAVYDIRGRLVEHLLSKAFDAGEHKVTWDGSANASGVYLMVMKAGHRVVTQKCTLLK